MELREGMSWYSVAYLAGDGRWLVANGPPHKAKAKFWTEEEAREYFDAVMDGDVEMERVSDEFTANTPLRITKKVRYHTDTGTIRTSETIVEPISINEYKEKRIYT